MKILFFFEILIKWLTIHRVKETLLIMILYLITTDVVTGYNKFVFMNIFN